MTTTLDVDEDLLRQAEEFGAAAGKPLAAVVEEALRELLIQRRGTAPQTTARPLKLPVFHSGGAASQLNLDDNRAWRDHLDEVDPDFTTRSLDGS